MASGSYDDHAGAWIISPEGEVLWELPADLRQDRALFTQRLDPQGRLHLFTVGNRADSRRLAGRVALLHAAW